MNTQQDYLEVSFQLASEADEKLIHQIQEYNERLVYEDRLPPKTRHWVALLT